tara:strand:+ start:996 stop:1475 length:480 start_codon:yes stop_codon:yes gene_type:complete
MTIAVYPGTFDPLTRGHQDIVRRASALFEQIILAVAESPNKSPFFTLEERVLIAKEVFQENDMVKVYGFTGLLRDFLYSHRAKVIIRGLRAVSDFEFEFQMAGMNRHLMPEIETVFLTPSEQYQFISGTIVREIAVLGGDVSEFVYPSVRSHLKKKLAK